VVGKSKYKFEAVKFVSAVLLCEGIGILGSITTVSSVGSWYQTLNKPFFNPPSWVFGPAWTLLYFLMGTALYLVWIRKQISAWFWIQLFLNFTWSFVFFGFKMTGLAYVNILLLWISIAMTIKDFHKVYKPAGIILLPYILWVSFASLLNFSVWILN
jgi:translocator protein